RQRDGHHRDRIGSRFAGARRPPPHLPPLTCAAVSGIVSVFVISSVPFLTGSATRRRRRKESGGCGDRVGCRMGFARAQYTDACATIYSDGMRASHTSKLDHLGDFTTSPRVLSISLLAVAIGLVASLVAAGLLKLIGLCTNLFFFQRFSTELISPAGHHLGPFVVLVPVAGALIIGAMARWGSERIRGHGIPEAIEAILMNGSRVEPKVALLKPLSSAIS